MLHSNLSKKQLGGQKETPGLQKSDLKPIKILNLRQAWSWLSTNLEASFTLLTFLGMMVGFLAEKLAWPSTVLITAYTVAYITGGYFGLRGGFASLKAREIDVDLLMVLAALGALAVGAPFEGVLLLFLFSLSNLLQDFALDRTRNAIQALMKLRPNQALVRRGDQLLNLAVEDVALGEYFLVKPGDRIPLDGKITNGESSVDQAAITGESIPVHKEPGDQVLAGTINQNGRFEAQVTKLAQDSTLAKLIKLVAEAQEEKAPTQRFLDKAEQYYALGVILFTIFVAIIPVLFFAESFQEAFYRAMTVMVAASPCALIISTPAAILSAIGNGARRGLLFKGGVYVEQAATIKVVAFDKTGTLTFGQPQMTDIMSIGQPQGENISTWQEDDLLALSAAVEFHSEHPLGQAAVDAAQARSLTLPEVEQFQAVTGKGVEARVDGLNIRLGKLTFFDDLELLGRKQAEAYLKELQAQGKTAILVAQVLPKKQQAQALGVLAFADQYRPDAAQVVGDLKALGVEKVVMLTGDNESVAQAIAQAVDVDLYYADLLPEDKVALLKTLQEQYGPVAMVGDGVNDAPALAQANIGVAMGAAGSDVALETADVVLMADDLKNIPYLIALSHKTRQTLLVNLSFALLMIVLMIAAIFGASLSLPLAVIGHEGGTVLVSLNGLRLLFFKPEFDQQTSQTAQRLSQVGDRFSDARL